MLAIVNRKKGNEKCLNIDLFNFIPELYITWNNWLVAVKMR